MIEIEEKENLLCLVLKIGNLKGLVREERFFVGFFDRQDINTVK